MKNLTQTVVIDDEGRLHDVLAANSIGAQSVHDDLQRMIDAGTAITVLVPGMPARAIVRKSAIERLTGQTLGGPELVALPYA